MDEFEAWAYSLEPAGQRAVNKAVEKLEVEGFTLGSPSSSAIKGSSVAMRELGIYALDKSGLNPYTSHHEHRNRQQPQPD